MKQCVLKMGMGCIKKLDRWGRSLNKKYIHEWVKSCSKMFKTGHIASEASKKAGSSAAEGFTTGAIKK